MSWFDRGGDAAKAKAQTFPLGARLGGAVVIDALRFKLAGDGFGFAVPQGAQIIEAIGVIDLGDGSRLYRLYLTDDAYLQIATTDAGSERAVGDITLFVYVDTINPADQAAFRRWLESGSMLGAATYAIEGNEYRRVWGEGDGVAWTPPIAFDEDVYKTAATIKDYDLSLYSMLYERDVADSKHVELLLVAAEDSGPNEFCVSLAIGVALDRADFEIT